MILVFDVTNPKSFENLEKWKKEFIEQAGVEHPESFPFLLVGNKVDLENRVVSQQRARAWAQSNIPDGLYLDVSAKDGTNVEQAFHKLAEKAMTNMKSIDINPIIHIPDLQPPPKHNDCMC